MPTKVCPKCNKDKPLSEYWTRKSRKGNQPASRCKLCSMDANREWRKANPDCEKIRYAKQKKETRERHLVRKYGVNLSMYDAMIIAQGGKCAICGKLEKDESYGVLHVDHCHKTGMVRGLLCRNCNHVLGLMQDNPNLMRLAASYVERPQIPELIGNAILDAIGWHEREAA